LLSADQPVGRKNATVFPFIFFLTVFPFKAGLTASYLKIGNESAWINFGQSDHFANFSESGAECAESEQIEKREKNVVNRNFIKIIRQKYLLLQWMN
jgi:hypothetical protein